MTRATPKTNPKTVKTPRNAAGGVVRPVGRPTLYKAEYTELAYNYCLLGATDAELALFFDVNVDSIHEWKKVHPEFSDALKDGKAKADADVAQKLFKRATGYEHKAVKISASPDGKEHVTEYIERYPPDTTAAIFWLKNRRPDVWRDKVDQSITGADGGPVQHSVVIKFV